MATKVYTEEVITLQDDTDITIRPLVIGRLRRLMNVWKKFETLKDDEDSFEIFINCSGIALEHAFKDKFDLEDIPKDEVLNAKYKKYLEDTLDMDTMYKVMEVCAGMKLNDPNLLAAARAMEAGTN